EPQRRDTVTLHLQVFICLNFLGHGGYQITVGQELNLAVSQPVVSRILKNICNILTIHLLPRHVRFPTTDEHVRKVKDRFTEKFNFPNVIGVVDGTHVAIVTPTIDDPNYPAVAYLNRKGYYKGQRDTWLLGDSGYPLQLWLMTPITDATPNSPEAHYTKCHARARNVGEQAAGRIIYSCAVLHNICRFYHVPDPEDSSDEEDDENDNNDDERNTGDVNILEEGRLVRRGLVEILWNRAENRIG
ncbi:hypothetical protein NQ314_011597, partial [Rhamnusium bicolor]